MIELKQVTKVFNKDKPSEVTALRGIDLSLEPGKITVLRGPSGSGKTTALSIIGAMTKPTSGRVNVFGREITSLPERFLAGIRRTSFGFIFQHFNLIRGISALENVMLPAYPLGERHASLRRRALHLLDLFGLTQRASSKIEWLSGGEAQRVTIARALINDPAIIIADEPTAHLDSQLSKEFMEIMANLNRQGKTILIASHDPLMYESSLAERVVDFRDGLIVSPGTSP